MDYFDHIEIPDGTGTGKPHVKAETMIRANPRKFGKFRALG